MWGIKNTASFNILSPVQVLVQRSHILTLYDINSHALPVTEPLISGTV